MYQMTHGLPRWFRLLFVAVMLALCATVATQILNHHDLAAQVSTIQGKLESAQKRLALQEKQLREAEAELPIVLAELKTAEPAAQSAVAQVADMKTRRTELRQTIAAQDAQIADLTAQLALLPDPADTAQQHDAVLTTLTEGRSDPQ